MVHVGRFSWTSRVAVIFKPVEMLPVNHVGRQLLRADSYRQRVAIDREARLARGLKPRDLGVHGVKFRDINGGLAVVRRGRRTGQGCWCTCEARYRGGEKDSDGHIASFFSVRANG